MENERKTKEQLINELAEMRQRLAELEAADTERKQAEEAQRDSIEKYRALYDNAPLPYQSLDQDGCFLDVNLAWLRTLGYEREQVIGKWFGDFLHPDCKPNFEKNFRAFKTRGYVHDMQFKIRDRGGHYLDIMFEGSIDYTPDGKFRQTYCVFQDITEWVRAECQLRLQSEIVANMSEGVNLVRASDRVLVYTNRRFEEIFGYGPGELVGQHVSVLNTPSERSPAEVAEDIADSLNERDYWRGEIANVKKDGTLFWCRATVSCFDHIEFGKVFVTVQTDITERVQTKKALQESEEKHRTLFQTMAQGVVYQAANGQITSANPAAEQILCLTFDQMQGRTSVDPRWQAIHKDGSDFPGDTHPSMVALRTGKKVRNVVMGVFSPQFNEHHWININAVPLFRPGENRPYQVYTTFGDITERVQMEKALRESEERYRSLFERVPVGLYRTTPEGRVLEANPAILEMLDYPDLESMLAVNTADGYVNPGESARWQDLMNREGMVRDFEAQCLRRDGTAIWTKDNARAVRDADGRVLYYEGATEDISERVRAEQALRESAREYRSLFETMAEGFAHNQIILDDQGRPIDYIFLNVNRSFEKLTGLQSGDILGKRATEVLPGVENDPADWIGTYGKVALSGEPISFERYSEPLNRWYNVVAYSPIRLQFVALFRDVTERVQATELLKASEMRFKELFHNMSSGCAIYEALRDGQDFIFKDLNRAGEQIDRVRGEELIGKNVVEMFPSIKAFGLFDVLQRVWWTGQPEHHPISLYRDERLVGWRENFVFRLPSGEIVAVYDDVTERKQADEQLRRSVEETARGQRLLLSLNQATQAVQRAHTAEEIYRTVGDEIAGLGYHATIFSPTDDRAHLSVAHLTLKPALLRAAEKLTGLSAEGYRFPLRPGGFFQRIVSGGKIVFTEAGVAPIAEALPRPLRPLAGRLADLLDWKQSIVAPLVVGGEVHGLLSVSGTDLTEADVPAVTAFANQASIALENAQLVEEARRRSSDLKELSAQLFRAQEEERRKISLELHDELGQALTGMGFDLAAIEREWPPELAPRTRERLANVGSLLAELDERVSEMALDLRPQMLDDLGLLPTLRWYVNRYASRMGIDVELEAVDVEERLSPELTTAVYRTVQEAMTNVAKHAGASRIVVRLERGESTIAAVVQDNGRGFDADKLSAQLPERGIGLLGIQERVAQLGGTFDIQSRPGQGTRLTMEFPILDL